MVAVTGGDDFLTLDVFRGVLGNKRFPLDPVLKENLGFSRLLVSWGTVLCLLSFGESCVFLVYCGSLELIFCPKLSGSGGRRARLFP